jgi:hypothetical protein
LRRVSRSDDGVLRYVVTLVEWADLLLVELRKEARWENTSGETRSD